ncbi:SAM-dependent chlorinase/fluorinase [Candidatus Micrarchaeota archaeon]|nr:SAM-dependent chlorinase/fluorinase [Candidatus Micrarchaeota archaeon]
MINLLNGRAVIECVLKSMRESMIVFLTDFGQSEYVGVMKGVIHSMLPNAKTVDLCNSISPQNVREGAWVLLKNYKYFPQSSVFLCVVDPGVGTARRGIAVKTKNYYFVGPDNGLVFPAASDDEIVELRALHSRGASKTFHGRDVFAKAAAAIAGKVFEKLGEKTVHLTHLGFHLDLDKREGELVRIDSFGNIVTNLPSAGKREYSVKYGSLERKMKFHETYAEARERMPFLLEGSSGTLEISLKNGNAAELLGWKSGKKIVIK